MKKNIVLSAVIMFVMMCLTQVVFASDFTTVRTIEDDKKAWTIQFSQEIQQTTLTNSTIYIQDNTGKKIETTLTDKKQRSVKIVPTEAYKANQQYTLYVTKNVYSTKNTPLTTEIKLPFILKAKQTYITKTETFYSPIVTNVVITGQVDVFRMTVAKASGQEEEMNYSTGNVYDRGVLAVSKGETLTIRAYDADNNLLETKQIQVQ